MDISRFSLAIGIDFANCRGGECAVIVNAPTDTTIKTASNQPLSMVFGKNDRMAGSVPVWSKNANFAENLAQAEENGANNESFSFGDLVDIINPLHHIPVVSNLYEAATGDTIGAIAKIVGGAIFGGPIGAVTSAGMVAYQAARSHENDTPDISDLNALQGTTIALADLRSGYTPYNT